MLSLKRRSFLHASGLALLATRCAARTPPTRSLGPEVELSSAVEDTFASREFHGTVLLAQGDEVRHHSAYGIANRQTGASIQPTDRFRWASVTKSLLATCAARLEANGALSLDSDVRQWLPDLPYEGITLGDLLSHTSGLPPDLELELEFEEVWTETQTIATTQQLYERVLAAPPKATKAGKAWAYSNAGYDLAALVLEKAAGDPVGELLRREVFQPATMQTAGIIVPGTNEDQGLETLGYVPTSDGGWAQPKDVPAFEAAVWTSGMVGASGVYGSALDLWAFAQSFDDDVLGVRERLVTPTRLANGKIVAEQSWEPFSYGLGLYVSPNYGTIWHTGDWAGYLALLKIWPATEGVARRVAVILQNHLIVDYGWFGPLEQIAAARAWT